MALSPPMSAIEATRLSALATYDILDTAREPQFDAITRLAAIVLQVPIALVSIVDADRQWFKSSYGLGVPQTPRDISFCAHVVASTTPLVVRDAHYDVRFADNPLVTGQPYVRFYAGMPLRTTEGLVLGTLCAIDHEPRELASRELESLELLAGQVMALLELRRSGSLREAALADQERKARALYAGLAEGVVMHDRNGDAVHYNEAAANVLDLSKRGTSDADARGDWELLRADGTPSPRDEWPVSVALRTGEPVVDQLMQTISGGERRWMSVSSRPVFEPGDARPYAVVSTLRDVGEQRGFAERLSRHERLVTTGTLAAGIGHEINNPLTYVLTNLGLAIEELEAIGGGSPSRRILEVIELLRQATEGGGKVKRIVRGLRSLAREDHEIADTDLAGVVRNALALANHELRGRATVELALAPTSTVATDESRLTQVMINLLVNAAQEFAVASDRNRITVRTRHDDRDVVIEVSDNGPGIPAAIVSRVFDPFFTTKPSRAGTGLGLSISHGIIVSLGGELDCETIEGAGTTFRIRLPAGTPRAAEVPAVTTAAPRTSARMLVIDDEATILTSMKRIFRAEFEVVTTDDPREALRWIERGDRFDVVFSDLTMPHLSGMELFDRVAATRPELAARIVFISGDLSRPDIEAFFRRVTNQRLEKPFDIAVIRAVARTVAQRGAATTSPS